MIRTLVSTLLWVVAATFCEWAVKVKPAPLRRVLEVDGTTLVEPKPRMLVETLYARRFSPEEAADVTRRAVLGMREEAQA